MGAGAPGPAFLVRGPTVITLFEYLAETQPWVLLWLQEQGLLVVEDYLPAGTARLMDHSAWNRVRRRLRQVRHR
ncbi:MAG: hypothetical protein AB1609_21510 [Bacillota bacterium]